MTIDLYSLIAYVFNCAVCATIGILFLLTPLRKDKEGKIDSYSKTRLCLAASAFIEGLTSLLYTVRIVNDVPYICPSTNSPARCSCTSLYAST